MRSRSFGFRVPLRKGAKPLAELWAIMGTEYLIKRVFIKYSVPIIAHNSHCRER
jgi:hypothetical protein